jgi:signal-transduction protein with cAMP-binding, CBS, and nucleotidyltransferase domain
LLLNTDLLSSSAVRQQAKELLAAQPVFLNLLVARQIRDIRPWHPASNAVEIKGLSRHERVRLRSALSFACHLEAMTRHLLFGS